MDNLSQNINIDNEIKIDNSPAPRPNDKIIQDENINPNQFQYQNQDEIKGIIRPQRIINKKFERQDKQLNKKNNPQQQTDTGLISDENLDHPKPLVSDYYDEGKDDIIQNFKKKKELERNIEKIEEIKNLDNHNLEENHEQKLDVRVGKKIENSFRNSKVEDKNKEKFVDNNEKNERRSDIINDGVDGMKLKENDNFNKEKQINIKSEYSLNYNPFREQLSHKSVNLNESVKIKKVQLANNTQKKIIVEDNKKVNINEIHKNHLNLSIEQKNKDNSINIKFSNISNISNANTEHKAKYYSNSKKNVSSNSKINNIPNSYTKSRPNLNTNINSCVRKISYGESTLDKKQQIPKYQNRIPLNYNNQKNASNYQTYSSNIKDKNPINKIPKAPINNKKYFGIAKNEPINEYNPSSYQSHNSINNEYFDDLKSLDSQKVGNQIYQKGRQFNNVQTTYVVYSKKEKNGECLSNTNPFKNMNKSQNINSSCLETKTPVKARHVNKNSCPIDNKIKSYNKNNEFSFKNYQYRSPYNENQKYVSRIPLYKTNDSSMNRSQNTLQVRRRFDYNDANERNTYNVKPRNYENNYLSGNPFQYNNQYPVDSRNKRINNNPKYNNYNCYQYDYGYNNGDEIPRNKTYDLNAKSNYNNNY
jgi:hypothetical protein